MQKKPINGIIINGLNIIIMKLIYPIHTVLIRNVPFQKYFLNFIMAATLTMRLLCNIFNLSRVSKC